MSRTDIVIQGVVLFANSRFFTRWLVSIDRKVNSSQNSLGRRGGV